MANKKLTAGKPQFEVIGVQPGLIIFNAVAIDLSVLSDKELGELHAQGCPYVQPVGNDASPEASV